MSQDADLLDLLMQFLVALAIRGGGELSITDEEFEVAQNGSGRIVIRNEDGKVVLRLNTVTNMEVPRWQH